MDQCLHLRRYFRPAIAKMRIMEPFFGTVLQFAQCYAGTVKMQSIDDNSYILPAGGQQQFLCLSEVGHAGPGDELNIHILSILRSQLAKPDKLFRIAFFVPVSYTHLDVYKRQVHQECQEEFSFWEK